MLFHGEHCHHHLRITKCNVATLQAFPYVLEKRRGSMAYRCCLTLCNLIHKQMIYIELLCLLGVILVQVIQLLTTHPTLQESGG